MAKTKKIVDLKPYNFSYDENGLTYRLLTLKRDKMNIEMAVFQGEKFLKNDFKPFAQIPKSLKSKINPL